MKRREFLGKAALVSGGALAGAVGCARDASAPAAGTQERVSWRLASSFPPGLDTIYGSAEVLAERVGAMSDGRFTIRAYPAGEIVPGLQVMDAVQQGTVQVGQTASYYFLGKNPALAFDATVPFGLTARQQAAWLNEGGGRDLLAPVFADFGIIAFSAGNTGAQMGGWFKHEIGSLADLNGLKMRIPGMGGQVMDRLGVTVQVLAGGDIYPALERGAIDATEWVGPYDDEKLGFQKIAKHYYYPGWWEPGPSLSFLVNRQAWDALPAEYQAVFRSAARSAECAMQERYDWKNPPALRRLVDGGVKLHPFPKDVMEAARKAAFEIMEEAAAKSDAYRTIYEPWKAARADLYHWFGTAELSFEDFAFRE